MLVDVRPHAAAARQERGGPDRRARPGVRRAHRATGAATDLSRLRVVCRLGAVPQQLPRTRRAAPGGRRRAAGAGRRPRRIAAARRRRDGDRGGRRAARPPQRRRQRGAAAVTLEEWGPTRPQLHLGVQRPVLAATCAWEEATGRGYEQALPGGQSDARNDDAAAARPIRELFAVWDALAERRALPEELYVVELGRRQRQPGPDLARRVPRARRASTAAGTTGGCTT